MAYYLDTSALVKLVVAETESAALRAWIAAEGSELVASDLARTELLRAVRRGAAQYVVQARRVLDSITLLKITAELFDKAGLLDPDILRSLDAIHIAAALELGDDLAGMVTYDERLADAARAHGIAVLAPR